MTPKRIRVHRTLRLFRSMKTLVRHGFFMQVDDTWAHIQGDPDMSAETREALAKMIRAAIRMRQEGKL